MRDVVDYTGMAKSKVFEKTDKKIQEVIRSRIKCLTAEEAKAAGYQVALDYKSELPPLIELRYGGKSRVRTRVK